MSVKVTMREAPLARDLGKLVDDTLREFSATLVDIADDAEHNAEDKWYTQVRRRTGRTDMVSAVVLSQDKRSYMVRRPGPSSVITRLLTDAEYSEAMRLWRATGKLPDLVEAQTYKDGRPVGLYRSSRNPLASDGKNLWQQLVLKDGKKLVERRARELDAALQRAADKLSKQ
jgi:hypothetical protein